MVNNKHVCNDQRLPAVATYSYRPNMLLKDINAECSWIDHGSSLISLTVENDTNFLFSTSTRVIRAIRCLQSMLHICKIVTYFIVQF